MKQNSLRSRDAQLADMKQLLCSPLARKESCEQDSFLRHRKVKISVMQKLPALLVFVWQIVKSVRRNAPAGCVPDSHFKK